METKKGLQEKIAKGLAIIYVVSLTWIILFKMQFPFENLPQIRHINLVPFAESAVVNGKIDFDEIIGNILIFIPAGLYLNMLKRNWSFFTKVGLIAGISLSYEVLQYLFGIGATDITDLIGNTLGGVVGLGMYRLFLKIGKTEAQANRILTFLASIGTMLMLSLLLLLIVMN